MQISKEQWGHISCVLGRNTIVRQPFMPSRACMSERTEGVLLIDALNAFNNLNHRATLVNVQRIYPAFANVLINTYRADPALYIETIFSREGTTQGDASPWQHMPYIGTLPLILCLKSGSKQIWYTDDSSAGGTLSNLRSWAFVNKRLSSGRHS